jgi:hypothetical protein
MNAIDRFVSDLRADPRFAESAQAIKEGIDALDREAEGCSASSADAAGLYECVYWVVGRPDRLLREKIEKICELIHRRGRQEGTIRQIVGW